MWTVLSGFAVLFCVLVGVNGHGRMVEPPMRSSAWRYGFNTTINYNDNELNCGGFPNQLKYGGRCGPCGDPWQGPRDHEAGGKYARGVITRQYSSGQVINVTIELTSNHKGYFEFRICPVNNPYHAVTQSCLDRQLLPILGFGTRYPIDAPDRRVFIELQVSLPAGLTCHQCVLQWKWRAAQNRGPDGKGGECFGCGPQEHFINCADVAISKIANPLPLNRPSAPGGAVVTFDQKSKSTAYKSNQIQQTVPEVTNYGYDSKPKSTRVDATNYMTEQSSVFSDQMMSPFDMNMGGATDMFGSMFYDTPTANYGMADTTANLNYGMGDFGYGSNFGGHVTVTTPTIQAPVQAPVQAPFQAPQQNSQDIFSSTRALTSAIMTYTASLGEMAGESAYMESCPDSFAKPTCKGTPIWNNNKQFDNWCATMCPVGNCPSAVCTCTCPKASVQRPRVQQQSRVHTPRCRGAQSWSDPTVDKLCASLCTLDGCQSDLCTCE